MTREVVEQAQVGNDVACNTLLRQLEPFLRTFFIHRVGPRSAVDIDDLVQNTLLRIHGGLSALRNPASIKPFARKAALFELHDLYRGRYSPKEHIIDPHILTDLSSTSTMETANKVDAERVLSVLSPHARNILELKTNGYRYREIAILLDTTETAIKMQVMRAVRKMRCVFNN